MDKIKFIGKKDLTLQNLLKENHISKRATNRLIKNGLTVNGKIVKKNIKIKKDDIIEVPIIDERIDYNPIKGEINVIYEDEHLIVIDKPSGITMNSKNQVNLSNYLAYYFKENNIKRKIRLINRLDMNTSGIMLIAKNKYAQSYYQKQIESNNLIKKYIAVVEGSLEIDNKITINISYDKENKLYYHSNEGVEAITVFKTIEKHNKYSLVEANILTGKTHQIRLSCKELGHPIVGDYLYSSTYDLDRFLLHSYYLEFREFLSGKKMIIQSKPDFDKYIKALEFKS
ncbi:MAG: RluA family pseudouridine synthase [Anaerococcus sp.]